MSPLATVYTIRRSAFSCCSQFGHREDIFTVWSSWMSVDVEEVIIFMVCLYLKLKTTFNYMTKILILLIKLVCDTTWLSSYFNTISKTLPLYVNELIVNLPYDIITFNLTAKLHMIPFTAAGALYIQIMFLGNPTNRLCLLVCSPTHHS